MNWSKDRSIALSRGCVVLFMILLAALDIGCYWAVRWFIGLRFMPWQSGVLMMVTIYLCSGFGWVLLVRLWQLLDNIRLQLVFDLRNVKLLRQVSWCCVGAGAVCLVSCLYYLPFIAVAIAAGFMALLVRLWQLLNNIRMQLVFDLRNVKLLRQVSWCCVGAGAVCLVSCLYYLPFIAVAIAAGFMALIVRIVKNIFQQAIDMKAELDLTI